MQKTTFWSCIELIDFVRSKSVVADITVQIKSLKSLKDVQKWKDRRKGLFTIWNLWDQNVFAFDGIFEYYILIYHNTLELLHK